LKQQHTLLYTTESQSTCHSKSADRDWLCEVFQTTGQERFMELICAGSDWGKGLGISQAADSVITEIVIGGACCEAAGLQSNVTNAAATRLGVRS